MSWTTSGYAKDYDAVVTVNIGGGTSTFALERREARLRLDR